MYLVRSYVIQMKIYFCKFVINADLDLKISMGYPFHGRDY